MFIYVVTAIMPFLLDFYMASVQDAPGDDTGKIR